MGQKDRRDVIHPVPMNSKAHRELSKLNGIKECVSGATNCIDEGGGIVGGLNIQHDDVR